MAKDKNKSPKKDKGPKKGKAKKSQHVLDGAVKSLRKFRKVTRSVGKLTTGQKVVGGVALLAAGLTYLAKRQADADALTKSAPGAEAAEAALASLSAPALADEPADSTLAEPSGSAEAVGKTRKHR